MIEKKHKLMILNRSFWPENDMHGRAYLELAIKLAQSNFSVTILTQMLTKDARKFNRHVDKKLLKLNHVNKLSKNSDPIIFRILDIIWFSFFLLLKLICVRPKTIYVATDPPILLPFMAAIYTRLTRGNLIYHVQDIHPEISLMTSPYFSKFKILATKIDNFSLRSASVVVTINEDMKTYLQQRCVPLTSIVTLMNPGTEVLKRKNLRKETQVIFCGNLGRLQHVPLLIQAIEKYNQTCTKLSFIFIGAGRYLQDVCKLADRYDNVFALGQLNASESVEHLLNSRWALLPIKDEATKYAFPSKLSTYINCGCHVLAICSQSTSVARFVAKHEVGSVIAPDSDVLANYLQKIANRNVKTLEYDTAEFQFTINQYIESLSRIIVQHVSNED
jgi:glycosyltransferase involved in cell wall biosynthesis